MSPGNLFSCYNLKIIHSFTTALYILEILTQRNIIIALNLPYVKRPGNLYICFPKIFLYGVGATGSKPTWLKHMQASLTEINPYPCEDPLKI
jgi:hypothetical protein